MSASASTIPAGGAIVARATSYRWIQLVLGIICMALIANLQYGWTLFVNPIDARLHFGKAAIQISFTIFVIVETWLVPVEGWLVDRFGPRPVVAGGALLAALGWVMNSFASSLNELYAAAVISGLGAGCVYGTCVGNALKWFPDKRGLAAGLTAAGFGAGAAITVVPIGNMIASSGYQATFFAFGIGQGLVILIMSIFMVKPDTRGVTAKPRIVTSKVDYSIWQMARKPVFWLTYGLFVAVAAGGLMATAQIGPIAKDYQLDKLPMSFLGFSTLPLLTLTLMIDNLANGFTRPLCGFISDRIGRENTMLIVFVGQGLALLGLMQYGHDPVAFMVCAALVFLCWGEIFSIFPALCADTFGARNAAGNAGLLYTAKGMGSLLVPLASVLSAGGNWNTVFTVSAGVAIAAGIIAKVVLEPLRRKTIAEANARGSV